MTSLIPQNLLNQIPDLYETERSLNPICQIKLFTPDSNFTWYIIEISKEDKSTCYGFVKGFESELGYFLLKELEQIKGKLGLGVERDISFKPTALAIVRKMK
jgi:Holliday junction resolvasome RuvABC DNA-binding subunit